MRPHTRSAVLSAWLAGDPKGGAAACVQAAYARQQARDGQPAEVPAPRVVPPAPSAPADAVAVSEQRRARHACVDCGAGLGTARRGTLRCLPCKQRRTAETRAAHDARAAERRKQERAA